MATLADKVNKNKNILKRGTGLFETTQETLMSRIRDRGVAPGAASSPMGAAGIGAQPDSAKMAGSAAQMQKAIRESVSPEEARKPREDRSILREEEQAAKAKADKLSNLELLGERIGGIVNQAVDKVQVAPTYKIDIQEDVISADYPDLTPENRTSFESIIAETTFDEKGNPVITEDMLGRVNALLPEDKKIASAEELKKYVVGATVGQLQLNTTKIKEVYPDVTDEQIAALEGIVAKAGLTEGGKPEDMSAEDLNKAAELLGITEATRDEIITKIKELITPTTTTVIDNITDAVGPAVALTDFTEEDWNAFGLSGAKELYELLGLDASDPEVQAMTLGDLQEKIDTLMQADYDRVEELVRVANDPFYPENIRKAAQAELRDLSSVGVIATESDFAKLNEAVQSADEIEIAGKTYTVEELLSDEQLTVLISSYLEDPESDYSKELLRDFPQLVEFIEDNKTALDSAMKYLDESIKNKIELAKSNDKFKSFESPDGAKINLNDINADLIDEYEGEAVFTDTTITPNSATHLENLYGPESVFNDSQKQAYASILRKAKDAKYDELLKEFGSLSSDAIKARAGVYGISIEQWMQRRYQQFETEKRIAAGISGSDEEAQAALTKVLGKTAEGLDEYLKSYNILTGYSLGGTDINMQLLAGSVVLNKNGSINYKATLQKFQKINSGNMAFKQKSLADWSKNVSASLKSKQYGDLFSALKDGYLSDGEVNSIISQSDQKQIDKLISIVQDKDAKGGLRRASGLSMAVDKYIVDKTRASIKDIFGTTEEISLAMTVSGGIVGLSEKLPYNTRNNKYIEIIDKLKKAEGQPGLPSYIKRELQKRIRVVQDLKTKSFEKMKKEAEFFAEKDREDEERYGEDDRYRQG